MPDITFKPLSEMTLEELELEQSGLFYWSDVLQDEHPERTQARINEIIAEIELRLSGQSEG